MLLSIFFEGNRLAGGSDRQSVAAIENPPATTGGISILLYNSLNRFSYRLHPSALAKSLKIAVFPGQAGAVIRLPSTTD